MDVLWKNGTNVKYTLIVTVIVIAKQFLWKTGEPLSRSPTQAQLSIYIAYDPF